MISAERYFYSKRHGKKILLERFRWAVMFNKRNLYNVMSNNGYEGLKQIVELLNFKDDFDLIALIYTETFINCMRPLIEKRFIDNIGAVTGNDSSKYSYEMACSDYRTVDRKRYPSFFPMIFKKKVICNELSSNFPKDEELFKIFNYGSAKYVKVFGKLRLFDIIYSNNENDLIKLLSF